MAVKEGRGARGKVISFRGGFDTFFWVLGHCTRPGTLARQPGLSIGMHASSMKSNARVDLPGSSGLRAPVGGKDGGGVEAGELLVAQIDERSGQPPASSRP